MSSHPDTDRLHNHLSRLHSDLDRALFDIIDDTFTQGRSPDSAPRGRCPLLTRVRAEACGSYDIAIRAGSLDELILAAIEVIGLAVAEAETPRRYVQFRDDRPDEATGPSLDDGRWFTARFMPVSQDWHIDGVDWSYDTDELFIGPPAAEPLDAPYDTTDTTLKPRDLVL